MNYERLSAVEQKLKRKRRICWLIVLLLIGFGLYYFVFARTYVMSFKDDIEHFKYGSIGSEGSSGLPYWVFKALPHLFKDKLGPQGYGKFGFIYETPDSDIPIGFSQRVVQGVNRVWLNCAGCHVGTYIDPAGEQKLVVGGSANRMRLLDFIQFFREAAVDTRLTADNLLESIEAVGGDLNFFERLIYRYIVVGRVKQGLLVLRGQLSFLDRSDLNDWGPGRVDTFNPYKAIQFNFPMDGKDLPARSLNGSSDYPAIWMQRPREGMNLHWDGNNSSVAERNLSAALGAGVTPVTVDHESLARVRNWLWDFPAPEFPALKNVDRALVAEGAKLYKSYCAECHGGTVYDAEPGGYDYDTNRYPRLGQVELLKGIGTDDGRLASYTENFSGTQNLLYTGYPWRFSHFRKTAGYANHPLDGIWARSPYLHNGSVPTLRDLMEPSRNRPQAFYRGSNRFDWDKVGYESYASAAVVGQEALEPGLFLYKTTEQGNANSGHEGEAYGTNLSEREKDAIVEYMKTF